MLTPLPPDLDTADDAALTRFANRLVDEARQTLAPASPTAQAIGRGASREEVARLARNEGLAELADGLDAVVEAGRRRHGTQRQPARRDSLTAAQLAIFNLDAPRDQTTG